MNSVSFREAHSRGIRFWHWATVLVMSFQLLTAFTGKFFFNNIKISGVLDEQLQKKGVHLQGEKIWDITYALKDNVWRWHTWIGYILSGLLVLRILIEFFQPSGEKFSARIKNSIKWLKRKEERKSTVHYLIVKVIYLLAYLLIGVLAGTGIWMGLNRNTPVYFTEQFHFVKEIHELGVNFFMVFLLIHIVGVIRAERGKYSNIVSGMIHGEKKVKDPGLV